MVTDLRPNPNYPPLSPEWWIDRLYRDIVQRIEPVSTYDRYYRGDFPLPWLAPQAADEFRRILAMTRSNYCGLIVDAMVERMNVEGFRIGDEQTADLKLWDIWQWNNMDADFDQGLLEAAIAGQSYLLIEPNKKDSSKPHIHIEHPTQATVEFVPGTNRRETAAGAKVWDDEWTGRIHAVLFVDEGKRRGVRVYKFEADKPRVSGGRYRRIEWERREVRGETWGGRSPLDEVSLYELPNNPRLLTGGVSELADVLDVQDRIVKTIADRLMTQDYGAFPQKWASAWPETDEEGNPTPPIEVGRNRMITTEVAETRFGQFDAAEILGYAAAKDADVKDMASRTRTPAQYLLGEMSNVNGETLKASESGLVSKVRQRCRSHSDPVERAMRSVRKLAGLATPGDASERMEVVWRNPEFRTEGELVDALFKLGSPPINMPRVVVWEKWGATQTEINRWERLMREQRRSDDLLMLYTERLKAQVEVETAEQISASRPTPAPGDGARPPTPRTTSRSGGGGNRRRRGRGDGDGDGIENETNL